MIKKEGLAIIAILVWLAAACVGAQAANDVPKGDWSYSAVQDLASKGLVQGYPSKGDIFGSRTVNRYEMAALVSRVVARLADDQQALQTAAPQTREEVAKLLQDFSVELTVMGTDISNLKLGLQAVTDTLQDQQKSISSLQKQEDASYGSSKSNKFSITGLIESRAVTADSGSRKYFPVGSNNSVGIASAYNGTYAMNGTPTSLEVKRARIIMLGQPQPNTSYKIQLDMAGSVTNNTTQAKVLEAYGKYTPGDGSSKYPSISMGEFANPFGYILPLSPYGFITPERPIAFSENTNYGMWDNQDYDKGVRIVYGPSKSPLTLTYAAVNGSGRESENVTGHIDSIYRAALSSKDKVLNAGISYYNGLCYETGTAGTQLTPLGKKDIVGLDGQIFAKGGAFLIGEFEKGTYEKLDYFSESNGAFSFGDTSLPKVGNNTDYVKRNQAQGYYEWGGYTFNRTSPRPWTIAADYDVFQRAMSNSMPHFHGSEYDDVNYGFGTMYNFDKSTRLRLWYEKPLAVAHAYNNPTEIPKYGLYTAEMTFLF